MIYRDHFSTAQAAQDGAVAAIARLQAQMVAATTAAGATIPTAAPVVTTTLLRVDPVPPGALPAGTEAYSIVTWQLTCADGRIETVRSYMPTVQINPATGGIVTLSATTAATATVRLSVAYGVYVTNGYNGLTIPSGAVFQDLATGKRYLLPLTNMTSAAAYVAPITEADATDRSEVTHGTLLYPVTDGTWSPPSGLQAQILAMKPETISGGTQLVDPLTGLTYSVVDAQSIPDTTAATGYATKAIPIQGAVPGANSVAVGTSLNWSSGAQPAGISKVVSVTTSASVTVPAGQEMTCDETTIGYRTLAAVTIGDALTAPAAIAPDAGISAVALAVGSHMSLVSPPAGVVATGAPTNPNVVTSANQATLIPGAFGVGEVIGDEPQWGLRVMRAGDGRWIADVFTLPLGS